MDMRDEVEQIILRTMVKEGMDAAPQDYEFLMKYDLKQIYFYSIDCSMNGAGIDLKSPILEKLKKAIINTTFPLLHDEYKKNGKAGVMKKLLNNEAYYKTFLKCIRMVSKNVVDYLERIKRLYNLIKQERTGSLSDIAKKMRLSRRTIANYISELKSLGADISYDKQRNTYFFNNQFVLYATFEVKLST